MREQFIDGLLLSLNDWKAIEIMNQPLLLPPQLDFGH